MISTMKRQYFTEFNIDLDKAKRRALVNTENGMVTAATEMLGEAIIRKFKLWNELFPNYQSVKKATSKKNQTEGIDFFVTEEDGNVLNIDIKVCCGPDFSLNKEHCYRKPECHRVIVPDEGTTNKQAPIELKQNGVRTFTSRKKTDYILFIFADTYGVSYANLPYEDILNVVDGSISKYENVKDEQGFTIEVFNKERGPYKHYTSNNGSGEYICHQVVAKILTII